MEGVSKYPEFLTTLGMKQDSDKWNNPSKSFALEQIDKTRRDLEHMRKTFDVTKLDADHALSYRLFEIQSEQEINGAKWWDYGYTFNQMFGKQSGIPAFLINRHRIRDISDAKAYIARLNGVKAYMDAHIKNEKASAAKGIQPPLYVYAHVIRDAENIIKGEPFTDGKLSTILADFKKKIDKLDISDKEREGLYVDAVAALNTSFKPAYENLISEMKSMQAKASTDDGAWKLPDGGDYYASRLQEMTTTDMSAEAIHALGLSEVDRIHAEMREIMAKVEFEGSLQDFFEFTRTDKQFFKAENDLGRAAYLQEATVFIDDMKLRLPEVFNRLPKAKLDVRAVEAFREKAAGKAFYNRPAPDGSRPGIYYANLYRMDAMPVYQMEALAYHEGIPGHHMQLSISQELEGIPSFRKYGRFTAYSEGWGLYSEYLPKEMGLYADPYSDFGRLAMELWRAARLVVDTGLHEKKWSREKAIEYLMVNTPNPESDAIKAIERYIVMPGQATAYKIGMNKILELRENAKTELGEDFDIRDFHDAILATGPVPLNIMEEQVDVYIARASVK